MIRRLNFPFDEAAFRALRREGLARAADSFRSTLSDEDRSPRQLGSYTSGADNAVFGAFLRDELVGIVGFERETRSTMQHKGWVWGMYVRAEASGQGLGRQLLRAATAHARTVPRLEHVLLTVVATNANARNLYASEGFETIGREPRALKRNGQYFDEETMLHSLVAVGSTKVS